MEVDLVGHSNNENKYNVNYEALNENFAGDVSISGKELI